MSLLRHIPAVLCLYARKRAKKVEHPAHAALSERVGSVNGRTAGAKGAAQTISLRNSVRLCSNKHLF